MSSLLFQNKFSEIISNYQLQDFISSLRNAGDVVIFGGALRDWILDFEPKDIDLVIDCPDAQLEQICNKYDAQKNSFGGYKLIINNLKIDIWTSNSTWAFHNGYEINSLDHIQNTSFHNLSAITYNIFSNKILENNFYSGLKSNTLDIVFENNFKPIYVVTKSLILCNKYGFKLSDKLKQFMSFHMNKNRFGKRFTNSYQIINYGKIIYSFNQCMKAFNE